MGFTPPSFGSILSSLGSGISGLAGPTPSSQSASAAGTVSPDLPNTSASTAAPAALTGNILGGDQQTPREQPQFTPPPQPTFTPPPQQTGQPMATPWFTQPGVQTPQQVPYVYPQQREAAMGGGAAPPPQPEPEQFAMDQGVGPTPEAGPEQYAQDQGFIPGTEPTAGTAPAATATTTAPDTAATSVSAIPPEASGGREIGGGGAGAPAAKTQPQFNPLQALIDLLTKGPNAFAKDLQSMAQIVGPGYGPQPSSQGYGQHGYGYGEPPPSPGAAPERPTFTGETAAATAPRGPAAAPVSAPSVAAAAPGPTVAEAPPRPPEAVPEVPETAEAPTPSIPQIAPATAAAAPGAPGGEDFETWRENQIKQEPSTYELYKKYGGRIGPPVNSAQERQMAPGSAAAAIRAGYDGAAARELPNGARMATNGLPGGTTPNAPPASPGFGAVPNQQNRPFHYRTKVSVEGGGTYDGGSGGGQFASAPYGTYYVHPKAVGSVGKSIGAVAGFSDNVNPGDNTVHDPLFRGSAGTSARIGTEIHPVGPSFRTNGCIGIAQRQFGAFHRDFDALAQKGPMIVVVAPEGITIRSAQPTQPVQATPPATAPVGLPGNLARLQEGGIVTRPTMAMIGEAGPEAVVPLRQQPFSPSLQQVAQLLPGGPRAQGQPGALMDLSDVQQQAERAGDPVPADQRSPEWQQWRERWMGRSRTPHYPQAPEPQG